MIIYIVFLQDLKNKHKRNKGAFDTEIDNLNIRMDAKKVNLVLQELLNSYNKKNLCICLYRNMLILQKRKKGNKKP